MLSGSLDIASAHVEGLHALCRLLPVLFLMSFLVPDSVLGALFIEWTRKSFLQHP